MIDIPRIINQTKKKDDMAIWIIGSMKMNHISQENMADRLQMSRRTFERKIKSAGFDYLELVTIFRVLGADKDTISRLMG